MRPDSGALVSASNKKVIVVIGDGLRMDQISVVFLTRGGIPEHRREVIDALSAEPNVDVTVVVERAGRQEDSLIGEFRRLYDDHGLYALTYVWNFVRSRIVSNDETGEDARLSVPVRWVDDVHSDTSIELIESLDPDLGIVYGHRIIKPTVFRIPRFGSLGVHAGTVPEYRGKMADFWEMYHGEPSTAVTIQKIEAGIDTGDIVSQVPVPIGRGESLRRVRERIRGVTKEELVRIVNAYRETEGNVQLTPQRSSGQLYTVPKLRHRVLFVLRRYYGRLLERISA